jgi:hypothetical protein
MARAYPSKPGGPAVSIRKEVASNHQDDADDLHDRRGEPNINYCGRKGPMLPGPCEGYEYGIRDQELGNEEEKDPSGVGLPEFIFLFGEPSL